MGVGLGPRLRRSLIPVLMFKRTPAMIVSMATVNRAAREPAEDVVRRMKAACEAAGLVINMRMNQLVPERKARIIDVEASPPGWPHKLDMLGVVAWMDLAGNLGPVRIGCHASDADPKGFWDIVGAGAEVPLEDLADTLKLILAERTTVMQRLANGKKPPFPDLRYGWDVPEGIVPPTPFSPT
jgi:hypothetical protein